MTVTAGDLTGPGGTIPAGAIDVGYVSYRISRVTMEGSVYTISPRLIMPGGVGGHAQGHHAAVLADGQDAGRRQAGRLQGHGHDPSGAGQPPAEVPVEFRVRAGTLDPVDIPAGPWGYTIGIPWYGDDPAAAEYNRQMTLKSLRKMREYGFTTCSGIPSIAYRGFKDGKPVLDFTAADAADEAGQGIGVPGRGQLRRRRIRASTPTTRTPSAMNAAGFKDYAAFIRAVYAEVQKHADANGWLPVYYNLGDEPIGDDLVRSAENAEAYRKAFPKGPPYFTGGQQLHRQRPQGPPFPLGQGPARGQLERPRRGRR